MRSLALELRAACNAVPLPSWLALQVRLRAAADQIVSQSMEQQRDEVLLGCQAYLELMLRPAPADAETADGALHWLQCRSDHYLKFVTESTGRVVAHGSDLLGSLLRSGIGAHGRMAAVAFTGAMPASCMATIGRSSPPRDREPTSVSAAANAAGARSGSAAIGPAAVESCVLTHGYCPHVTGLLLRMAKQAHFTLVIAEGRPDGDGHRTAQELLLAGVPVLIIEPGAVARCMAQCRLVLCGAHAVLGDGGVLARIGTLTMAFAAQAHGRPFYVAAPHYAFSSTHHVDAAAQSKARARPHRAATSVGDAGGAAAGILVEEPRRDATPPHLITLLITDMGVFTPSAVADEMMRRRQPV